MKKTTKIWLIIATALVLAGCIIFGGVIMALKWDFNKLSTNKFETKTYGINKNFKSISINTQTADITFLPSEDDKCSVVCYEQKNMEHTVAITGETLSIELQDTRKWFEYIGINFGSPKITVYLPQGEYGALSLKVSTGDITIPSGYKFENMDIAGTTGDVINHAYASSDIKIKTSTGNIKIENTSANAIDLSVSTGKIEASQITATSDVEIHVLTGKAEVKNLKCQNLKSTGSTGTLNLANVIAENKFTLERTTGNIKFEDCDAAEIFIKTDTGNVKGSLLSSKVFIAKSDTGKVDVPKTITGGKCEVETDTGNIRINIK